MNNFIFSIEEVFTTCLAQYKVDGYYIGAYQRGYKWKSKTIHDQIPVLLSDLFEAFIKKQTSKSNSEYFLQYITVKKTIINRKQLFEVIDGQQRLTSLTLLFTVLEKFFKKDNITKKDTNYLLTYSRYEDDSLSIFDSIISLFKEDFKIEEIEEQDKYYMYLATQSFKNFFEILKEENEKDFEKFIEFIKENVKIIVNKEDEFTAAEEVFSSLNANKVPLTNAYLIKGLLLTKASRTLTNDEQKKHFKEIMDERAIMGRTWDEMNNWFSQKDVSLFYFNETANGMEKMLSLIELKTNKDASKILEKYKSTLDKNSKKFENNYELFNKFHEAVLNSEDAVYYLQKIKHLYKRLKSWYTDNNTYNKLGYYLCTGGKINSIYKLDNSQLTEILNSTIIKGISHDLENLNYNNNHLKNKITTLLLALSVFPEGIDRKKETNYRFDFYSFTNENWTLEHIFPQNPNSEKFNFSDDIDWIKLKLREQNLEEVITKYESTGELLIQDISFIFDSFEGVHSLGNMALLSGKVNSALSNGFYNTKRKILLNKINRGSFVPKHTIDIFSKMLEAKKDENEEIISFDSNLVNWSNDDANAHFFWIKDRVKSLRKEFIK